jgi:hypothetical protein
MAQGSTRTAAGTVTALGGRRSASRSWSDREGWARILGCLAAMAGGQA